MVRKFTENDSMILQSVCSNIILASLPWTYWTFFEQVIGTLNEKIID